MDRSYFEYWFKDVKNDTFNDLDDATMASEPGFLTNKEFDRLARKFFCEMNDESRPEYWSNQKLEYDAEENRKLNEWLCKDSTTFSDVLDYMFRRMVMYLSTNPEKPHYVKKNYYLLGTSGNSRPDQYEFSPYGFTRIAVYKLMHKYDVDPKGYELDLGYGHKATRCIYFSSPGVDITRKDFFNLDSLHASVEGDKTFHDELEEKSELMKNDFNAYRKSSRYLNKSIPDLIKELKEERNGDKDKHC